MPRELHSTRSHSSFQTKDGKPWDPCDNGILPIADALDSLQVGWPPKTSKELEQAIRANGQLTTLEHWLECCETPAHAEKFTKTVLKPVGQLKALEKKFRVCNAQSFADLDFLIDMEVRWVRDGHSADQLRYLEDKKSELCEEFNDICDEANRAAIYCRNKATIVRGRCDANPANVATREKWGKAQLEDEPQDLHLLAARSGGRDVNFGAQQRLTSLAHKILQAAEFAIDEGTLKGFVRPNPTSHVKYARDPQYKPRKGEPIGSILRNSRVPIGVVQDLRVDRYCRPSIFFAWAKKKGFPIPTEWDVPSASKGKNGKSKRDRGRPKLPAKTLALYWMIRATHIKGQSHQATANLVNEKHRSKGAITVTRDMVKQALDYTYQYPDTKPNTFQKRKDAAI